MIVFDCQLSAIVDSEFLSWQFHSALMASPNGVLSPVAVPLRNHYQTNHLLASPAPGVTPGVVPGQSPELTPSTRPCSTLFVANLGHLCSERRIFDIFSRWEYGRWFRPCIDVEDVMDRHAGMRRRKKEERSFHKLLKTLLFGRERLWVVTGMKVQYSICAVVGGASE